MTKHKQTNKISKKAASSLGNSLRNDRENRRHQFWKLAAFDKVESIQNEASAIFKGKTQKNVASVTHETDLEEFIAKAELANRNFKAERDNARFLTGRDLQCITPSVSEISSIKEVQRAYSDCLKIPRRPVYKNCGIDSEELTKKENENFLEWRLQLSELEKLDNIVLTPYERNIEIWRQLWRVVEKCDIIVQIVDARNPLIFRSEDLEKYVKECDVGKQNLLLVNKIDMLTKEQLNIWRRWIFKHRIEAVFWSAIDASTETTEDEVSKKNSACGIEEESRDRITVDDEIEQSRLHKCSEMADEKHVPVAGISGHNSDSDERQIVVDIGCPVIKSAAEFITHLKSRGCVSYRGPGCRPLMVGMVGYPNVGKSSTINKIIGCKKVSVSATPGKTKHIQTLVVDPELILCDCPGLVLPSLALSNSDMILHGILSINHARDYIRPVSLLLSRIPVAYFEETYSISLSTSKDGGDQPIGAHDLLTALAFMRGFMSVSGVPDCSRAARLLVNDIISGKLKWVSAPPDVDQTDFDKLSYVITLSRKAVEARSSVLVQQLIKRRLLNNAGEQIRELDAEFFMCHSGDVHVKNLRSMPATEKEQVSIINSKKHGNRGKKEKLRRIYDY